LSSTLSLAWRPETLQEEISHPRLANPIPHYNVFFPPDFYTAWRVIRRTIPTLPQDPSVAATWAELLGHGALDARAEPGPAAEVLALLWEAAKVCAFSSSCFGVYMLFDPLDLFVALCDLGNYYERPALELVIWYGSSKGS
jgi:hypothetical protein